MTEMVKKNNDEDEELDKIEDAILDLDGLFSENIDLLNDEMKITDSLYNDAKEHYDDVKKYDKEKSDLPFDMNLGSGKKRPRTQSFIHQQLANLISIRNHKSSIIKDRFAIQKEKASLMLKMYQLQGKENQADNSNQIINQIIMKIDKRDYDLTGKPIENNKVTTSDINSRINQLEGFDVKETKPVGSIEKFGILDGDSIVKYTVKEDGSIDIIDPDVNIPVDIDEDGKVFLIETGEIIEDVHI